MHDNCISARPYAGQTFQNVPQLSCRFGDVSYTVVARFIDAHTLECTTPAQAANTVNIQISVNGQQFTDVGTTFRFFPNTLPSATVPHQGTASGGIGVTLHFPDGKHRHAVHMYNQSTDLTLRSALHHCRLSGPGSSLQPWDFVSLWLGDYTSNVHWSEAYPLHGTSKPTGLRQSFDKFQLTRLPRWYVTVTACCLLLCMGIDLCT